MCPPWPTGKQQEAEHARRGGSSSSGSSSGRRSGLSNVPPREGGSRPSGQQPRAAGSVRAAAGSPPDPFPPSAAACRTAPLALSLSDEEEEVAFSEGAMMLWVEVSACAPACSCLRSCVHRTCWPRVVARGLGSQRLWNTARLAAQPCQLPHCRGHLPTLPEGNPPSGCPSHPSTHPPTHICRAPSC